MAPSPVDLPPGFWHNYLSRPTVQKEAYVSCSERKRELRRRRHRKKKLSILVRKLGKATVSEKTVIAEKLRALTPGGETIVARLDLDKR